MCWEGMASSLGLIEEHLKLGKSKIYNTSKERKFLNFTDFSPSTKKINSTHLLVL